MPIRKQRITPCLWFDKNGEDAAKFYTGIFKNSRITGSHAIRQGRTGDPPARRRASVMTVEFELDGQKFTALNGGPHFKFNEAVSLQVECENQEEIDYYWEKLGAGGDPTAQQCGWLKDKFGLSWQVTPRHDRVPEPGRELGGRRARDGGDAEDEEDRHRRAAASG